jgi:hypothetical protein
MLFEVLCIKLLLKSDLSYSTDKNVNDNWNTELVACGM